MFCFCFLKCILSFVANWSLPLNVYRQYIEEGQKVEGQPSPGLKFQYDFVVVSKVRRVFKEFQEICTNSVNQELKDSAQ